MNTQLIPLGELLSHPFQIHIPDMAGKEWTDFKADILTRGVQDPIRVSSRTGSWVVVDGHQRLRAARESGYTHLTALVQAFADEGEEVSYIAGCFNFHRNSTDAQKTRVAMAQEEYFAVAAKEAQRESGRYDRSGGEQVCPNLGKPEKEAPKRTDADVAESVGLKRETYRKGKKVLKEGSEQVKADWEKGKVSTDAAYQITKAPKDIQDIMHADGLTSPEMALILKNPEVRARVEAGEVRARVAADRLKAHKKAIDDQLRSSGKKALFALTGVLDKFLAFSEADLSDAAFGDRETVNLPDYLDKAAAQLMRLSLCMQGGVIQTDSSDVAKAVA